MKTSLTCLVTGLLVSGAWGATTIKMVDHATGLEDILTLTNFPAGGVYTIDIIITTDEGDAENPASGTGYGGLVSWGINGLQPPDPGYRIASQITTANYAVGDAFNWDSTQGLTTSKGTYPRVWPALPGVSLGTICYIDTTVEPAVVWPATSGIVMQFTMTIPWESVGVFTAQSVYAGRFPSGNSDVTFVPLQINIPEPATLLLLAAGGLAAARRRR